MIFLFSSFGTPVRDNWNLLVFSSCGTLCLQCSFWQVLYFCVVCEWAPSDSELSGSPKFAIYIWLLLEGLWISILSLCLCTYILFFQCFFFCLHHFFSVFMSVYIGESVMCTWHSHVWWSEDIFQKLILSFHYMNPGLFSGLRLQGKNLCVSPALVLHKDSLTGLRLTNLG